MPGGSKKIVHSKNSDLLTKLVKEWDQGGALLDKKLDSSEHTTVMRVEGEYI